MLDRKSKPSSPASCSQVRRDRGGRVAEIDHILPGAARRIAIVEGDITAPDLGLANRSRLAGQVTEIFHFAADLDLSVSREVGMRVNVEGTKHVLDCAEACTALERVQYVSTCYVSGKSTGSSASNLEGSVNNLVCGYPRRD